MAATPAVVINAARSRAFLDVARFLADVNDRQELVDINALVCERIDAMTAAVQQARPVTMKEEHKLLENVNMPPGLLDTIRYASIASMARGELDWVQLIVVFGNLRVEFGSQLARYGPRPNEYFTSLSFTICSPDDKISTSDKLLWSVDIQGEAHYHEPKGKHRLCDRDFHAKVCEAVDVKHYRQFLYPPAWLAECPIWGSLRLARLEPEDHQLALGFIFYVLDACLLAQEHSEVFRNYRNASYIARNNLEHIRRQHTGRLAWNDHAHHPGKLKNNDPPTTRSPVLPTPVPKPLERIEPKGRHRDAPIDDRRRKFARASR